jgi:putative membrane-bound dehydrogenase-like protein
MKKFLLCGICTAAVFLQSGPVHAKDFADQLPRIEPTEPGETLDDFQVAAGFKIQLVASEPLIGTPVAIEWDADGALFVCEMRGYSENRDDKLSRISKLHDTDGDGVFDKSVVFADELFWPTAIFPYDGGLFVADAPDVFYLKDTDGDGKADQRTDVLTGFSTANVQGLLNCFRWGLDNRIHLACGTVGGNVHRADQDSSTAINVRGHDLALDPETFEFELTSGGAQHGMCFDDWGRKFVSSNSDHLQQVLYEDRYVARNPYLVAPSTRQTIAADGPQAEVYRISPVEPWRVVRTRLRAAGLVRGVVEGGGRPAGYFTGATGVTIYRGDAWPKQEHTIAIVGDVGSNLVHRKRLTANGVPRIGHRIDEQSEFVASEDIWFRPAQFACGPDGGLSIVDVYREVIEHPRSLPPEIKQHLDLTSGRERGRIYRVVPEDYDFSSRPELSRSPNLSQLSSEELVRLLAHDNAWHRETAARLLYQRQDASIVPMLQTQAHQSDSPLGRLHSLYALQGLSALTADDVAKRLDDSHPQVVRHAVRFSESFRDQPQQFIDAFETLVEHPEIEVRYQLAFTLGEFEIDNRFDLLAAILAQTPSDRWIQTAVASSVGKQPERLFVEVLDNAPSQIDDAFLTALAQQIVRGKDQQAVAEAIEAVVQSSPRPESLPALMQLWRAADTKQIDDELRRRGEQTRDRLVELALGVLKDQDRSESERIAAIRWTRQTKDERVLEALVKTLRRSISSELQLAAIGALRSHDSPEVMETVLELWQGWSPRLRNAAGDILFANPKRSMAVLDAIDEGKISANDFSLVRWNALASSGDKALQQRAKTFLAKSGSGSREEVIEQYQSVLSMSGDVIRGKAVFKQQCAGCHQSEGMGHAIGPNLEAAATRGAASILTNVLDPSREVNPQYFNYVVLTTEGRSIAGMIAAENANSITLGQAESKKETVLREDIELIRNTNQSIMPEGFEKAIPPQAMADLIAYLIDTVSKSPL